MAAAAVIKKTAALLCNPSAKYHHHLPAQLTNLKHLLPHTRSYATTPDDFDLIAAEAGLARFDNYTEEGFVVNTVSMQGAVMACGSLFTMWKVERLQDVTPDSLSLLQLLRPPPELLILGTGRTLRSMPPEAREWCRENMVNVEVLDTRHAVSTFNILNMEARTVACAMLPLGAD